MMLGQVIHGYRIEHALSEDKGGFGDVYFATHVDSGAEAVVKVLKPEMSALRDIVARFFNEARAAASIHHPGIVQIHNVGYHGDRAYLLMERLRGGDLETRLDKGPLPIDRTLIFMRQAAGAIGAAHERGIVHRDLKPANLFVVEDPDVIGGERVKVLDFGIAKLTADSGAGKTQGIFGSPPYMSPEQCASTGAVDARSDLYSLGCIFYELVCGRPPFGHGGIELIASHLRDTPPPPRALAPWLPPPIEQVILGLLEKQPDRRIPSCAALIAAIDEASRASGLPGASAPSLQMGGTGRIGGPSGMGHATTLGSFAGASTQPPAKRSRGVWLGVAAIVVVGSAVTAVMTVGGHGPAAPPAPGDGGVAAATADAATAVGTPDAAQLAAVVVDAAVEPAADAAQQTGAGDKPPTDRSPSQAAIAARLNEEAKDAIYNEHYDVAVKKLQEAVARVPEAKYFVNLCVAQLQLGRLDEALTACHAVDLNHPTSEHRRKASMLIAKIRDEAKKQGLELHADPRTDLQHEPPVPPPPASPQGKAPERPTAQAEIARKLNDEGKALMYADKAEEAAKKFEQAAARVPDPTYVLNLCVAKFQSGRFQDAFNACKGIDMYSPSAEQRARAAKMIERIKAEAKKQGVELL
jgi:serine/threonine-protein kinase